MKQQILLAATLALFMTGCAQKKVNTLEANSGSTGIKNGATASVSNGSLGGAGSAGNTLYNNVDPYGNGAGTGAGLGNTYGSNDDYGDSALTNIYFNVDQYNITADKLSIVSRNTKMLREDIAAGAKVKIEGHCDASGSDEYNYALGLRRANATKNALISNGIRSNRITLVSMGESAPECSYSSSAECYSKNRRVEFKVIR